MLPWREDNMQPGCTGIRYGEYRGMDFVFVIYLPLTEGESCYVEHCHKVDMSVVSKNIQ